MPSDPSLAAVGTVRFAHGKDSSPRGTKLQRLAEVASGRGFAVESPDYSGTTDAEARVRQLLALGRPSGMLVLVGSSMGAYVSTVASAALKPDGLFLLAPAFYLAGYADQDPVAHAHDVEIVHGWDDEVVPVDHALHFVQRQREGARPRLHILPDGHRLEVVLPEIAVLFDQFLSRLLTRSD